MPVLHPFDHLFIFQFFAPTILRLVVGVVLLQLAWFHYNHRNTIAEVKFMLVGKGSWIPWVLIAVEVAVAVSLIAGYRTQPAALVGVLLMLKNIVWKHRYPTVFTLSRLESTLLLFIMLSLVFTGAGLLAFDLHL